MRKLESGKAEAGVQQSFIAAVASEFRAERKGNECMDLKTASQSYLTQKFYNLRVYQTIFNGTINYSGEKSAQSGKYVKPGNSRAGAGSSM